ncbi:MAG: hypothetical protein AB7Y46_16750, partial [Armatimonadota bacterium]
MAAELVMTHEAVPRFFGRLLDDGPVMGPRERARQPGFCQFDWLTDAGDLVLQYTTTTIPPKKAFFPPRDVLFEFELTDPPRFEAMRDTQPFTLVGVHPCDLEALKLLDQAYAQEPAEACWPANRARARVIGVDCLPDEYCFCLSVGSCHSRAGADLFLTPIERGYLVEVVSEAGRDMLRVSDVEDAKDEDRRQAAQFRARKGQSLVAAHDATP